MSRSQEGGGEDYENERDLNKGPKWGKGGFTSAKVLALLVQKYLLTGTKVLAYWYKSTNTGT